MAKQEAHDASLEMVLVRYYQQHAALLPSAEMARIALAYWSDFFAGATVSEVTAQRQREFVVWLRESGPKSDGYIKRILTVGKSALMRAYKEGEIASAPFILPGTDSPARDFELSPDQSRALWAAARLPHERMYLALAYGTLARPEAILGLDWSFVDMERRMIDQNPPGRRQTKKYRPVVPVCDWLAPWLAEGGSGPIVAWRGQPIASFKTAWRSLRRRADLPEAYVPKTIRHTMATALRAADVPEAEIQGMLGHKAYGGKTEVYAHFRPNHLGKAAVAISTYMAALRVSCVLE
jgi:integrase